MIDFEKELSENAESSPDPFKAFLDTLLDNNSEDVYSKMQEYVDRFVLSRVLDRTGGNQSAAARILGITRGSLRFKLKQRGMSIDSVIVSKPRREG